MSSQAITVDDAAAHIAEKSFRPGPVQRVGVELEWIIRMLDNPVESTPLRLVDSIFAECGDLPSGARLTCEPGGQVELSSSPGAGLESCLADTTADLELLRLAAQRHGAALVGIGLDPIRAPHQVVHAPRYQAMAEYYASYSPAGALMMCSSASIQVCVDAGPGDPTARWNLAHAIGPVLVGAFANSPMRNGKPTGWRSTRWWVWDQLRPRHAPLPASMSTDRDVRETYAEFCLDSPVMCIRNSQQPWSLPRGLTLREWITSSTLQRPTLDDIDYHLSTLFPPVRAQGYLEIRMIDAQPHDGWRVPLAVACALMDDPKAADVAMAATEELRSLPGDSWLVAAREGLANPVIAQAARTCFSAAEAALSGSSAHKDVLAFRERYVERGRCPADDLTD